MAKDLTDKEDAIVKRLDALIRLYIENVKRMDEKFTDKESIRILHSSGLTPTEIAKIIGWKSRTSVASQLYAKTKGKN